MSRSFHSPLCVSIGPWRVRGLSGGVLGGVRKRKVCDRTRLLWTVHAQNTITTRIERIDGRI